MKLLENTIFESVASYIIANAIDFTLDFRLESYSCKMISTDKKEWKKSIKSNDVNNSNNSGEKGATDIKFVSQGEDVFMPLSASPNFSSIVMQNYRHGRLRHVSEPSCSGSDNDMEENGNGLTIMGVVPRRTLFDIVALLNLSYSDYDFTQTKSASFSIVNYHDCVQNVDAKFSATVTGYARVRDEIWKVIRDEIKVDDCIIYSYIPSYTSDPFTEDGCIWSFNYLFHNKFLKRFVFFACRALRCDENNFDLSSEQLWGADEIMCEEEVDPRHIVEEDERIEQSTVG